MLYFCPFLSVLSELLILFDSIIFLCWTVCNWALKHHIHAFFHCVNFILPPLLHSFSITGLQNLCKGFPALVTNTAGTSQSPHNCYSIQSLGLLINENSDNQGWFWVTLISACSASSGANWSLFMWLSSFIPCRYLEALYSDLKITLAWFSVRSTVPVGKNLCAVIG